MKLSTVLMGVGIGAFALVGCGGGSTPSSDSLPMKPANAEIEKNQVPSVLSHLGHTYLLFDKLGSIANNGSMAKALGSNGSSEKRSYTDLPDAGEQNCTAYVVEAFTNVTHGTKKVEYLTGDSNKQYNKQGNVVYTEEKKECIDGKGFNRTEKRKVTKSWNVDEEKHASTSNGTTELMSNEAVRKKDDNNTYTMNSYHYEWSYKENKQGWEDYEKDSYSSKGRYDGHPFEKYGIVTTSTTTGSTDSWYTEKASGSLRGSFKYESYKGWFTVVTDEKFVVEHPDEANAACIAGKATIKGKDATIVIECKEKQVKVTYNGEEV